MPDSLDEKFGVALPPFDPPGIKQWERQGGYVIDNPTLQTLHKKDRLNVDKNKHYIWTVDSDGLLRVGEEVNVGNDQAGNERYLGHPTLVKGGNARISRELEYDKTENEWVISEKSGRYTNNYLYNRKIKHLQNAGKLFEKAGLAVIVEPLFLT